MKTKNIYTKLFNAKKSIGKISKDSTNPFFKSKYFDINKLLEHVEPILLENDLIVLQPIENGNVITTIIDSETGESVKSGLSLPEIQDPQKLGSAITYYRRYTLQSLLGLQAEDDDANASTKAVNTQDNRPWLDQKGFDYLITKGSKEDIQKAFDGRRMKKDYKVELNTKLKNLSNYEN